MPPCGYLIFILINLHSLEFRKWVLDTNEIDIVSVVKLYFIKSIEYLKLRFQ